eukprot:scaffold759_cov290-Alexandrium_tamarense.AAC.62
MEQMGTPMVGSPSFNPSAVTEIGIMAIKPSVVEGVNHNTKLASFAITTTLILKRKTLCIGEREEAQRRVLRRHLEC